MSIKNFSKISQRQWYNKKLFPSDSTYRRILRKKEEGKNEY